MVREGKHKPGSRLEVFEHGRWVPCIILKVASYSGRSGPGYYAAYDPANPHCSEFWCHDRVLRARTQAGA
jgi:hypothetical protein